MAALLIGQTEKEAIAKLVELASQNPLDGTKGTTQQAMNALREFMGNLTLTLPIGYMVTYSHEKRPNDVLVKHISVSVDRPRKLPGEFAVLMIMEAFGMPSFKTVPSQIWIEQVGHDFAAVNVVQGWTGE